MTYWHWLAGLSAAFLVVERLRPREARSLLRPGFATDLVYLIFNGHYLGVLAAWLAPAWFVVPALVGLPSWAQLIVALVGVDFFQWNIHRALHRVPFLWRFHKVHHSIERMDWIGSFRFHAGEGLFYKALTYPLLAGLGIEGQVLFAVAVISTAVGHFNHSNLDVSIGPLRYVLNSPAMHVWHHAHPTERATPCNFGITLSVWDWMLGTAWMPERPPSRIGLDSTFPTSFVGQLWWPLRRSA